MLNIQARLLFDITTLFAQIIQNTRICWKYNGNINSISLDDQMINFILNKIVVRIFVCKKSRIHLLFSDLRGSLAITGGDDAQLESQSLYMSLQGSLFLENKFFDGCIYSGWQYSRKKPVCLENKNIEHADVLAQSEGDYGKQLITF